VIVSFVDIGGIVKFYAKLSFHISLKKVWQCIFWTTNRLIHYLNCFFINTVSKCFL